LASARRGEERALWIGWATGDEMSIVVVDFTVASSHVADDFRESR
jgi:hypothetical protein